MRIKRLFALLLVFALAATLAFPALAAELEETEDAPAETETTETEDGGEAGETEMLDTTVTYDPTAGLTANPVPDTTAGSAVLMEASTGTVLWESNAHEPREPASVTKVMTMLLVCEALDSGALTLDQTVTCSAHAAGMGGSQIYLEEGEQMTVDELLKAVAVCSGNDAAVALAEAVAGSESAFAERMNARAKELGMADTHFANCTGLPADGHVTSAYDIAVMSRELLKHDVIRQYTGIWMDSLRGGEFQLASTNKLLKTYNGITGLKTGFTSTAGYCMSATACRDDMELIAVVMGAKDSKDRFSTASTLLDFGFANFRLVTVAPEEALPQVAVELGQEESVSLEPVSTTLLVRSADADSVNARTVVSECLEAPVCQGDPAGTFLVEVAGQTAYSCPILCASDVEKQSAGNVFRQFIKNLLSGTG